MRSFKIFVQVGMQGCVEVEIPEKSDEAKEPTCTAYMDTLKKSQLFFVVRGDGGEEADPVTIQATQMALDVVARLHAKAVHDATEEAFAKDENAELSGNMPKGDA